MPELLLEVGCEELPASFVRKAYTDLESAITGRLLEAGIPFGSSISMGTPRRLIVQVQDVEDRQPDVRKDQRGPGLAAAFDASGHPTKALVGFCRSQGVELADVRKDGDYVWITKTILGKSTAEVLESLLPDAIHSLTFEKAMRWGTLRMRFARPLRWILAAFGGSLVSFSVEGLASGLTTRGHRSHFPEPFQATSLNQLVNGLRDHNVEPDPAEREKTIRQSILAATSGRPDVPDGLVEENVFLTEWPKAIEGSFLEEYLELPGAVLVTAMAKHERFFPVRDERGRITNRFVSVRNGGVDGVVREGNAWVLNARFNDAKFFFDEDRKHTLDDFLLKTKGVIFQDKLGTIHQRAYRLVHVAGEVAAATNAGPHEADLAKQAALYAKADLTTGLVSELPALQGLIGAEYARREGLADPVCWAIASQYDLARNPVIDCAGARTAIRLLMADQLDKLAGYLGIGPAPRGSSDPYGLRRAATLLIDSALRWPARFGGFRSLFESAQNAYREQGFDLSPALPQFAEIFRSRYVAIFSDARYDVIEAALLDDYAGEFEELDSQAVRFRIKALERVEGDTEFVQTATRPQNIVTAAVSKEIGFTFHQPLDGLRDGDLESEEGRRLADIARSLAKPVESAAANEEHESLIRHLRTLQGPINAFFDSTMVMVEDERVRTARLTLLHGVHLLVRQAGDFSKIVIPGK